MEPLGMCPVLGSGINRRDNLTCFEVIIGECTLLSSGPAKDMPRFLVWHSLDYTIKINIKTALSYCSVVRSLSCWCQELCLICWRHVFNPYRAERFPLRFMHETTLISAKHFICPRQSRFGRQMQNIVSRTDQMPSLLRR